MEILNQVSGGKQTMRNWFASFLVVGLVLGSWSLAAADGRTLVRFGSDLVVEQGMRVRDAVAIGGQVTVNGIVEHDAVAVGGSVILGPNAVVGRSVVSVGGTIEQAEGAAVHGDLVEVNIPGLASLVTSLSRNGWQGLRWAFGIISLIAFIGFLALAMMIVAILPKPVALVSTAVEAHLLKSALWGLLVVVLVVPSAVFLAISVVGIVLIPVEIVLVVCAILVGYVAVARLVGRKISIAFRKPDQPMIWETFWGLIILWVIGWVPILGWGIKSVAALLGLGGVMAALLHAGKA
jgi:hypothetical protein